MLVLDKTGLWAGHVNVWGDWAAHISYVTTLSAQNFFPPQFPILAGHVLSYPFGSDLISAILVRLSSPLVESMLVPSFLFSILLVVALFLFYKTILQDGKTASLAIFLFLLNGGLGFLWFINDFAGIGPGILASLPREYTLMRDGPNIQWINIIISELIPQRGFLLGLPLTLLVFLVFWQIYTKQRVAMWKIIITGVITGLMPIIHMHSFLVILLVGVWTIFLVALHTKKIPLIMLLFPAITFLLALPIIHTFYPHFGTTPILFQPGWLASEGSDNIFFFWLKNAGIMLFLPLLGLRLAPKGLVLWTLPLLGLFAANNLFVFQPYAWDNTKFFTYWWLASAGFASIFLKHIAAKGLQFKILALIFAVIAIASGSLDILRVTQYEQNKIRLLSAQDIELATWAKNNTPKESIFLTAPNHDNPIAMLSGRRIVLGFLGWLWTYGVDIGNRQSMVERLYEGDLTPIKELQVDFVVIGPQERYRFAGLNEEFFAKNYPVVFEQDDTRVFAINP